MPDVSFRVTGARAVMHAVVPGLAIDLELSSSNDVRSLVLQAQVRIDAPQRSYTAAEQAALVELFGEPSRWGRTLTGLLWANVTTTVAQFTGTTEVELALPVTFDLSFAAAKYFTAVEGRVPITIFFSGTVFHETAAGLQASLLSRTAQASFDLPAELWRQALDHQFPNLTVLSVDRLVFDRLRRFQLARGFPSIDRALEELLGAQP